jgi:soluble lytic murein transglycosylase-like protein
MDVARSPAVSAAMQPPPRSGPTAPDPRLQQVARDFEALLVGTLLRAMRNTVIESDLYDGQGEIKYYRQLYDEQLARQATSGRGGFGIAELILQQFASAREKTPAEADLPSPQVLLQPDAGHSRAELPQLTVQRALARYQRRLLPAADRPDLEGLRERARGAGSSVADSLTRFEREITDAAQRTGTDPALLLAVMTAESGGDPQARSVQGALGLMQLMPATAAELGVQQPLHPAENILGGARYLADMLQRFGQRLDLALAAYNAGPGAVQCAGHEVPPYAETRKYVHRVLQLYQQLGPGKAPGGPAGSDSQPLETLKEEGRP